MVHPAGCPTQCDNLKQWRPGDWGSVPTRELKQGHNFLVQLWSLVNGPPSGIPPTSPSADSFQTKKILASLLSLQIMVQYGLQPFDSQNNIYIPLIYSPRSLGRSVPMEKEHKRQKALKEKGGQMQ